uniref:NAC domain-containing protein n=1 Tax=Leersia perrieri TaxID=77586 RepID=A0A0D9VEW5_9ORYZ
MVTAAESHGLSPGFKFDPTDEMLVELYLLPYLRYRRLPYPGLVFIDDPRRLPPWLLLRHHGRGGEGEDAYFIAPAAGGKGRQPRSVAGGGRWVKQRTNSSSEKKGSNNNDLVVFGGEAFRWEKSSLNFHCHADRRSGSTGWVMHEIAVFPPPGSAVVVDHRVCHIAFTGHGQNRNRVPDGYVVDDFDVQMNEEQQQEQQSNQQLLPVNQDCFLQQQPLAGSNLERFLDQEQQSNQDQGYYGGDYFADQQNLQCFVQEQQQQINQGQELAYAYGEQNQCYTAPEQQQQSNQGDDVTQWQQPDGLDGGGALSWREYMDDAEMQHIIDGLLADFTL